MSEKEAIEILDNIFVEMLIEKEVGKKYIEAIKALLAYYKHFKSGFVRELESNRENTLEIIEQDIKIRNYEKAIKKKDKIIDEMTDSLVNIGFISEGFECVSNNENCLNDCCKHIKQYFERKIEK